MQRRAHSNKIKNMLLVLSPPISKRTHLKGAVATTCRAPRGCQVGVLPHDPSHGQQRGGADRGGAAVSGARGHLRCSAYSSKVGPRSLAKLVTRLTVEFMEISGDYIYDYNSMRL